MKIGIIGAGQVGGALARRLAQLGHATDMDLDAARRALSQAVRELDIQKMIQLMQQPQGFTHQDLIQMLRSLH